MADDGTGCTEAKCTLRDAIEFAQAEATITFAPGLAGTITLTQGDLEIRKNLTISGPGAMSLSVSGTGASRVFHIASGATVSQSRLTITGGYSPYGGGIDNSGRLAIENSTISGNSADADGGGIYSWGALSLQNSTVWGNTARAGGGINITLGTLALRSSLVAGNTATLWGAADLLVDEMAVVFGSVDASYSLIGSSEGHSIAHGSNGNIVGVSAENLELGALELDTPGTTATHALLPASPALDSIPHGTDGCGTSVTRDQRGLLRPQGAGCDIGAFELVPAPPTPAELLEALISASASTPRISRGTQNKLLEARHHLNQGQLGPACNKLREYIAAVQSQSGKKITAADAARLIGMAQEVRSALGC